MNRESKIIMVAVLCVAVLSLTVAYSVLSANLEISGTGTVNAGTWQVAFSGSTAAGSTGGTTATCPDASLSGTSATITGIALKKPGDNCTYNLTIANTGSIAAKLTGLSPTTPAVTLKGTEASKFQEYVKYTVQYGGTAVTNGITGLNQSLEATRGTVAVVLKVEFLSTATAVPAEALTIEGISTTFSYGAA